MEEIGITISKYQTLQVLWHSLLCDYARRAILSCPICPLLENWYLHCLMNQKPKVHQIGSASFLIQPYKIRPKILYGCQFFLFLYFYLYFIFLTHFFVGLTELA